MINLPTTKQEPIVTNPKFLVIFGKPKTGKSTIASMLSNNLIIDLEHGCDYLSALVINASNVDELSEIASTIAAKNVELGKFAYEYITIDNATRLEEMIMPLALRLYKDTPMGKNFNGDVRKLPEGAGYLYMREAYFKVIDAFKDLAPHFILIGHLADKLINKDGKELNEMSLDLTGKAARLVLSRADAVAYIYRKKNQTILNFNGGDDTIVEARQIHLRGKEIIIAESNEDNEISAYWDKVYLPKI